MVARFDVQACARVDSCGSCAMLTVNAVAYDVVVAIDGGFVAW